MQAQARCIHLIDGLRRIQYTENSAQPRRVSGDDAGFGTGFEEGAQIKSTLTLFIPIYS